VFEAARNCRAQSNQQTVSWRNKKNSRARVFYKWKSANNKEEKIILSELSGYTIKVTIRAREQDFIAHLQFTRLKRARAALLFMGRRRVMILFGTARVLSYQERERERRWALKRVRAAAAHTQHSHKKTVEITQRCFHLRKMLSLPLIVRWKKRRDT
jgi:hypothetical protein